VSGKCQGNVRELFISGNVRELFFGWLIIYKISKTLRKSDKTVNNVIKSKKLPVARALISSFE